ncbi:MAG: hypothetical protein ACLPN1_18575 [Dissulfurispiraceae bacterium]
MMKIFLFISAFVVVIFGVNFSAYAAEYTATASLAASEQYNDNILLTHTERIYDYVTLIAPSIALSAKTEKADINLNYSPTFNEYLYHNERDSTSQQASIGGTYRLTDKVKLDLSDAFIQSREYTDIISTEGDGPVSRAQEKITSNTVSGDMSYKLSAKINLLGNASYTNTNSEGLTATVKSYVGGLGVQYLFNDRTTFRVNGAYTLFDYQLTGDATSGNYIAGVNYKLTPTLTADAYGGVADTHIDKPSSTDISFTGGLSITKTLERGTASISVVQNIIAGFESSSPIRAQMASLQYSAPVTPSLDATISAFYRRYRAIGLTGVSESSGIVDTNRNDTGGTAELSYRLLSWLSANVSYSYIYSVAVMNDAETYVNNIIMVGIKLSKSAKF